MCCSLSRFRVAACVCTTAAPYLGELIEHADKAEGRELAVLVLGVVAHKVLVDEELVDGDGPDGGDGVRVRLDELLPGVSHSRPACTSTKERRRRRRRRRREGGRRKTFSEKHSSEISRFDHITWEAEEHKNDRRWYTETGDVSR